MKRIIWSSSLVETWKTYNIRWRYDNHWKQPQQENQKKDQENIDKGYETSWSIRKKKKIKLIWGKNNNVAFPNTYDSKLNYDAWFKVQII